MITKPKYSEVPEDCRVHVDHLKGNDLINELISSREMTKNQVFQ